MTKQTVANKMLTGFPWDSTELSAPLTLPGALLAPSYVEQVAITKPANPPAGSMRLYPKADGNYYKLDSAGNESILGGASLAPWSITGGHFRVAPDNTYDIGAPGATRPRTIYAATGVDTPLVNSPSGFLTLQAATNVSITTTSGPIYISPNGSAKWKFESDGSLYPMTDNAYDVGISGAVRPRNLILGGYIEIPTRTTPANPPLGSLRWYPKADGLFYRLDSNGVESSMQGPKGDQGPQGIQGIQGPPGPGGADVAISPWSVETNDLTVVPDNTYNIGESTTKRPRALYLGEFQQFGEVAVPATPPPGNVRIFAKTDHKLYVVDSTGTEGPISPVYDPLYLNEGLVINTGTLTFTGAGNRILADMSSAPNSARLMFQNSNANAASYLGIKPSGTGLGGAIIVYEIDDTANSPYGILWNDGTQVVVGTGASGTGLGKPLSIWANGEVMRLETDGTVKFTKTAQRIQGDFSNATHANRVLFQTSTANSDTIIGVISSGTSRRTAFNLYNNPDTAVAVTLQSSIDATKATLVTTGAIPLTLAMNSIERQRMDTNSSAISAPSDVRINANAYYDGTNWQRYDTSNPLWHINVSRLSLNMYTAPAGTGAPAWTQRLALDASGNLTVSSNVRGTYLETTDGSNGIVRSMNGSLYVRGANGTVYIDGGGGLYISGGLLSVAGQISSPTKVLLTASSGGYTIANAPGGGAYYGMEIQQPGGGACMIAFHRPGYYAAHFGLDSDNIWRVGGWSMGGGAWRLVLGDNFSNAGTINGSFSGTLNSMTHSGHLTMSGGYIFGSYINMTADVAGGRPTYVAGNNGDNYMRWWPIATIGPPSGVTQVTQSWGNPGSNGRVQVSAFQPTRTGYWCVSMVGRSDGSGGNARYWLNIDGLGDVTYGDADAGGSEWCRATIGAHYFYNGILGPSNWIRTIVDKADNTVTGQTWAYFIPVQGYPN